MRMQLLGISLFAATAAAVAFHPAASRPLPAAPATAPPALVQAQGAPRIEVVFALDTTGSMGGLIEAAKEKIWSIAASMAQADPAPEIRIGLVAYRDRGDAYVTQTIDLSADLDSMYATLMDFRAAGGGDGPEAVNQALSAAVENMSWSPSQDVYKVVFLVGDAPPHTDYHGERQYPQTLALARERGIIVNTVRCGTNPATGRAWQDIARLAGGDFLDVGQDGDAVAVATPFDADLAELSAAMDATRMVYGDAAARAADEARSAATAKLHAAASAGSRARRAAFNASAGGERNFLGEHDLVDAWEDGRVDLEHAAPETLPAPLAAMAPAAREAAVQAESEKRAELKTRIGELASQRDAYIQAQLEASGGRSDSLDDRIHTTVARQAALRGLRLEEAPRY